jgi:hypothetical protein
MNTARTSERFLRHMLLLLSGPLVWAAHFALAYATHHIACSSLPSDRAVTIVYVVLALTTVLALGGIGWLARDTGSFIHRDDADAERAFAVSVTRLLLLLAGVAVLWTAAAALGLRPCLDLR